MCRRTEEEVGPTVGLPRHRHFVGFFNVPVLAPTRDHPFYMVIPPHLVAFYDYAGDTEDTRRKMHITSDVIERVDIVKLIFLMDNRQIDKYKGKTLGDIQLNDKMFMSELKFDKKYWKCTNAHMVNIVNLIRFKMVYTSE